MKGKDSVVLLLERNITRLSSSLAILFFVWQLCSSIILLFYFLPPSWRFPPSPSKRLPTGWSSRFLQCLDILKSLWLLFLPRRWMNVWVSNVFVWLHALPVYLQFRPFHWPRMISSDSTLQHRLEDNANVESCMRDLDEKKQKIEFRNGLLAFCKQESHSCIAVKDDASLNYISWKESSDKNH